MDMYVAYDTLVTLENKLEKINYNLSHSVGTMKSAIQTSGEFLSGNQYEKVKNITESCILLNEQTGKNNGRADEGIHADPQ